MAVRSATVTREYIEAAPLPVHGQTYTIISHKFVIDETLKALSANGFEIEKELYRCNRGADIAQGIYHLKYDGDPEMGLMFTWSNSYDKSMRFRCATGGFVTVSDNRIIAGSKSRDMWTRKHTGTADAEARKMIERYIQNAGLYYKELLQTRDLMKGVTVSTQQFSEIMGRLFFEKNILSGEQMLIVKDQFRNGKFDYGAEKDSLWTLYNHIAYALQKSHPRKWMDQQTIIHWFICDLFDLTDKVDPVVIPEVAAPVAEVSMLEAAPEEVPTPLTDPATSTEVHAEVGVTAEPHPVLELPEAVDPATTVTAVEFTVEETHPEEVAAAELENWMLEECKSMGVNVDKSNRFLFFKEGQEVSEKLFNATVELGWTIQPSLPFPVEEN